MRPIAYITLGFAPIVAIGIYFYCKKQYDKSFLNLLTMSFIIGAFSIAIVLFAEMLSTWLGLNNVHSLKRTLFYSFVTIGGISEFAKFFLFRYFILPDKLIDRPMHGITFSVMTALGFSSLFLLFYALDLFGTQQIFPVTLYPFLFVPANILFAIIMGFFTGMAKFLKARFFFYLTGFLGPAFFHGIFNFCLLSHDYKLLSLFSFGSMVIVFILGLKAAYTKPGLS
ncbi:MAG: PrsW family glutamic-type intramembrane protease [Bacteroidales bacterium]|nr:PrsW family glutamic-type intramembrane protease [Bacteroidales bacterium]